MAYYNFKLFKRIRDKFSPLEYDPSVYLEILKDIKNITLDNLSGQQLKETSDELRKKAQQGVCLDELLVEAFALVREASVLVLGMRPFDVQVMAAIALHQGKVVEMQTGEGKTLAAVMPAYLNALMGKGVHVLTFNDYLAGRDAAWMGPVYRYLGLTVGCVKEGMSNCQRQKAYRADVTYVTAKEAGFDYLRDFLCTDQSELVLRELNYAIIDEADSILIDEARIPLVISGFVEESSYDWTKLRTVVHSMTASVDYELDQFGANISLTEKGLKETERNLGCGNLYRQENLELLTRLNCTLHAEFLLKRDKDYIVKNGKIEIIDEFTGRIAERRHWPDNLHAAVEVKEGVVCSSKGHVLGSIALQHFISLYGKICGMTGTAQAAAREFKEYYNLDIAVIPTNKPCIRKDYEDYILEDKISKKQAVLSEVLKIHRTERPILIGTDSVEESEELAGLLRNEGVQCRVLNARNDELEAEIIARAGELNAVTVSTNMAGRGVDIKLGGSDQRAYEEVAALGGLFIISTNRHESRRIDEQLRGRAGRQGDPGSSRFFVSLEDDWVKKYEIAKQLPAAFFRKKDKAVIPEESLRRIIQRGQLFVEGYNSDLRIQLWKYSFILEQQRRIIHKRRQDLLMGKAFQPILADRAKKRYLELYEVYGEALLLKVEKQLTLYFINKHWADYLDCISYMRESMHLMVIGGKNPLFEFNKQAVEAYKVMLAQLEEDIIVAFEKIEVTDTGINMEKEGLMAPSSTWTYLMDESPSQFSNVQELMRKVSNCIIGPLFTFSSLYKMILKRIIPGAQCKRR